MVYKEEEKLFIRFLKERRMFSIWFDFVLISNYNGYHGKGIDFYKWFNNCRKEGYIMCGFNWGKCNSHNNSNILWSCLHNDWLILLRCYKK